VILVLYERGLSVVWVGMFWNYFRDILYIVVYIFGYAYTIGVI